MIHWMRAGFGSALAVGALLLGLAVGAQINTALQVRTHLQIQILPTQLEELAYRLRQQERAQEALEAQVEQFRHQVSQYEIGIAGQQTHLQTLSGQLQRLKLLAGLQAVTGPGVVVEMDDSPRPLRPGENPNEVILHNYDVAEIVNELFAAGAEAVSIEGQRVIPTTPIRSVATTMMVNARRVTPPLHIVAIGDSQRLEAYLHRSGGYLGLLKAFTFPVRVTRYDRVTVPAYKGSLAFRRLQPVDRIEP